jgi:ligand-binding SRPBCC domain-containing protein
LKKEDNIYQLTRKIIIPSTIDEVWCFFSSPRNLARITPAYMDFTIEECPEVPEIFEGMEIRYRIRPLMHIPVTWVTRIGKVSRPYSFVDTQLKGPYALWEHLHTFKEHSGGVLMTDHVRYALPFGLLGAMANALVIERSLKNIFDYREKTVMKIFRA